MNISPTDLEKLKCISCESYLSRGPIFLQHDGAAVCGRCYAPKRPATRNIQYETSAKYLRFPCKYQDLGCRDTVPFVNEDDIVAHEDVCKYRQYFCPVLGSARCDWVGFRKDILQHCKEHHPDKVVGNPTSFMYDITKSSVQTFLLCAYQVLFLLHTKVCVASGKVFHAVRFLGASEEASNYHFTLDIKRNDLLLSKPGTVSPQGCLTIQEDSSLALTMNSLLDFLDGFDGTTFTVTVKRKADQLTRRMDASQCVECGAEVLVFRYRDSRGWLCERCAPARRACENQGCSYTDTDPKSGKHEWYFCQQRTQCRICDLAIPRGTLSTHYEVNHKGDTYRAGATWRTTQTDTFRRRCLLSTAAGTAACSYRLDASYFVLGVYLPVASERLQEFRCVVKLSNPATGHSRTYAPDLEYSERYDWRIEVKREEFQPWSGEFDVQVDVVSLHPIF